MPKGTYARLCLSYWSEMDSPEQSRHKRVTEKQSKGRLTGGIQSAHAMLCRTSCQHTVSGSRQEATSFFPKQQDKAVSMHTRGNMRSSTSNRKKATSGNENVINSGFQLGIKKFSGYLSKALTVLLQFKIPMALPSKFRMKKQILVTGFLTIQTLPDLRTYPRSQDRLGYAYHCRCEGSKRLHVYF